MKLNLKNSKISLGGGEINNLSLSTLQAESEISCLFLWVKVVDPFIPLKSTP
jgi:hypothetical protein